MLPIVLVLLVAQSAFGAPAVQLSLANFNEVAPSKDNGRLVNRHVSDGAFDLIDRGELNVYTLTAVNVLGDLAGAPDSYSQALAVGQTINLLAELTGPASDGCEYTNIINEAVSGNSGAAQRAYASRLARNIDTIVKFAQNPNAARLAASRNGSCAGGARGFNLEAAWDSILSNASQIGLLNEQYCTVKRLYGATSASSNSAAAALTAASLAPSAYVNEAALGPLANFLRSVASGANPAQAGLAAQRAIRSAV
ncbi:hypothetical protein JYU34_010410 [Plutella xylostella]|uniref:Fibroin light chain n=1 Tax=Plutella xylostella TaxID=51655 RepID=A0ABQ7QIC0_PLUXY|nr:hypothetical protein JYU34_010410 [Plutella xylostella]